jgi:hypothetical protein
MAGIHDLNTALGRAFVDTRAKPGHDGRRFVSPSFVPERPCPVAALGPA